MDREALSSLIDRENMGDDFSIRFVFEGKGKARWTHRPREGRMEREKGRIDTISEWLERDEELTFLTLSSFCTVFMMIIVSISTILPRPPHRKHYYYAIYIITDIHLESLSIIARKEGKGNSVLSLWYTLNSVYMHLSIRIYIYRVCVHAYPRVCIRMCVVCVCLLFTFNLWAVCTRNWHVQRRWRRNKGLFRRWLAVIGS